MTKNPTKHSARGCWLSAAVGRLLPLALPRQPVRLGRSVSCLRLTGVVAFAGPFAALASALAVASSLAVASTTAARRREGLLERASPAGAGEVV